MKIIPLRPAERNGVPWTIACLLYLAAHGLMLFYNEPYLDDFDLYRVPFDDVLQAYRDEGVLTAIPVLKLYYSLPSMELTVLAFRLFTFLTFLAVMWLMNAILRNVREMGDTDRYFIVVMAAIIPFEASRCWISMFLAIHNYLLFFCGFWFAARYFETRRLVYRVIAISLLFTSFFLSSLLVFYVSVLLYVLYIERPKRYSLDRLCNVLVRHADFVLIPVLFWSAKILYFPPTGWRMNYNTVNLQTLSGSPLMLLDGAYAMWTGLFDFTLGMLPANYFVILTVMVLLYILLAKTFRDSTNTRHDGAFFTLGILLFLAGLLPYAAVGKSPDFLNKSRHALLLPLGTSFTLYYGLKMLMNRMDLNPRVRLCVFSSILTLFVAATFQHNINYLLDGYKKLSLIEHFRESEALRDNTTFLFADETTDMNAKKIPLAWDDYTPLLDWAFGGQSRFGTHDPILLSDPKRFSRIMFYSQFGENHFKNYVAPDPVKPQYFVTIKHGSYVMTPRRVIKFVIFRILAQDIFKTDLRNMTRLEFTKL